MTSLSWVSENGLRFHIETSASAAENGKMWRALCGATGVCNFNRGAKAIVRNMRCATCQELSTTGIQDSVSDSRSECSLYQALNTGDGVSGCTEGRADEHKSDGQGEGEGRSNRVNDSEVTVRQTGRDCDCAKDLQIPNPKHYQLQVPTSGYQGPSADSQISWQAKLYSGEMLNGFERAVMDAEFRAGIVRSSSDYESGDALDAAMAQGWEA